MLLWATIFIFLLALNFFICRVFKCTKRLLLSVLFQLPKATFDVSFFFDNTNELGLAEGIEGVRLKSACPVDPVPL